jgi:hypothetical protein
MANGYWNPSEAVLCYFVAWASLRVKPATVRTYLCGIRNAHLAIGLRDPTSPGVYLKRAMKELAVQLGDSTKKRLSITTPLLKRVLRLIDVRSHNGRCLRAALALGVFLLIRVGELTGVGTFGLLRCDWKFSQIMGSLRLRRSKSDQMRQGIFLGCFPTLCEVCALKEMERYVTCSRVQLRPEGPLFMLEDGSQLNAAGFKRACDNLFSLLGFKAGDFSGISVRKGGALSMALAGVPDRVIRGTGRWKGWCYDRYICLTAGAVARAHAAMGALADKASCGDALPAADVWHVLE